MSREYMVYTDHGDYRIWARSRSDAAELVRFRNYCRVQIYSVEPIA